MKLRAAAEGGRTEEVIRLLDGGVNVDSTNKVRRVCHRSSPLSPQMNVDYEAHVHSDEVYHVNPSLCI